MLYFDFICSFNKTTEEFWRKRGFFEENGQINFDKVNNYIDLLLEHSSNGVRFYDFDGSLLKGVCKIYYKKICGEDPENILKPVLTKITDEKNLKISLTEITFETYLKRAQWGESLLQIRSPRTGKLIKIENTYLTEFTCRITEKLIDKTNLDEDEMMNKALELFIGSDFIKEVERIYQTEFLENFYGHPLHYVINNESQSRVNNIIEILTEALYTKGRIKSRRITILHDLDLNIFEYDEDNFIDLLKDNEGGTVVIDFAKTDELNFNLQDSESLKVFWNNVIKYKNKVLFIFINLPFEVTIGLRDKSAVRLKIISNGIVDSTDASLYVHDVIKNSDFKKVTNTFNYDMLLEKDEWQIAEIDKLIKEWQALVLRTEIFKLYY